MNVHTHPTAVVDEGAVVGDGTRIWHFTHVSQDVRIGKTCTLGQNVYVAPGVSIGHRVKIQNNVSLYSGVVCADDVFIGPSVVFTNVLTPRSFVDRTGEFARTQLDCGCTIGANATVVCGVRIGPYAMIGAGAVVTKDVAAYELVVGNPARHLGHVSRAGERLTFELGLATCTRTGERYQVDDDGIVSQLHEPSSPPID